MRILAFESYYGGSHKSFLDGWIRHSVHDWDLRTLPARKWKWRMRHSALTFARAVEESVEEAAAEWDAVFASDMLNFAEWKALAPRAVRELPAVVYFHENQLTYPVRFEKERDYQFGMTNITSALAADEAWFNSAFHRDEFLAAIPPFLKKMPDHRQFDLVERIRGRSRVLSPAVEETAELPPRAPGPLRVVWAARWEFDKAPEVLFDAARRLLERGVDFQLSVLGEQFEETPSAFAAAHRDLEPVLAHWGFVEDAGVYAQVLAEADVFVSTAIHEFFGLAAVEAASAGAWPLVPRRLAYPEVLEVEAYPQHARFFYDGSAGELAIALERLAATDRAVLRGEVTPLAERLRRFHWPRAAPRLDRALEAVRVSK